jgi:hypothetical protein
MLQLMSEVGSEIDPVLQEILEQLSKLTASKNKLEAHKELKNT